MKQFSIRVLSLAALAALSIGPGRAWAASKIAPSTGVATVVVASALSCPNVACQTGDTCTFMTFTGAAQSFTRFGSGLSKATILGCVAIDANSFVSIGSGAGGDTGCSGATGTFILTSTSKAGGLVTLAYAGQVCTLPTDPTRQTLRGAYVATGSSDKAITSAEGQVNAGFTFNGTVGAGGISFNGSRNF